MKNRKRIAIFASGSGSNAKKILEHFSDHPSTAVALVVTNNPIAGVIAIAASFSIPVLIVDKASFQAPGYIRSKMQEEQIDLIVLAGFLLLLPADLVRTYPNRIVNIHPSLLPKYGGKGMYGIRVHQAVLENQEKETGITIHYVNELYDEGEVIAQVKCPVHPHDTPEQLAKRVQELEHHHFPLTIESLLKKL